MARSAASSGNRCAPPEAPARGRAPWRGRGQDAEDHRVDHDHAAAPRADEAGHAPEVRRRQRAQNGRARAPRRYRQGGDPELEDREEDEERQQGDDGRCRRPGTARPGRSRARRAVGERGRQRDPGEEAAPAEAGLPLGRTREEAAHPLGGGAAQADGEALPDERGRAPPPPARARGSSAASPGVSAAKASAAAAPTPARASRPGQRLGQCRGAGARSAPLYQGRRTAMRRADRARPAPARSDVSARGHARHCGSDPISASQRCSRRVRSSLEP
jgi:hypothetical protein